MPGHFFISYSRLDAEAFALALADELESGPEGYRAWLDQREIRRSSRDWDDQLTEAIQTCEALVFVMTADSVRVGSGCKDEWAWALKFKKPVIPLRLETHAGLPFRLGSRQFVDFSADRSRGFAQLRRDLRWLRTPEGQLRELEARLAEAERELPRAEPVAAPRIETEIEQLRERIRAQRRLVADPRAAAEEADARIGAGIERERRPERPVAAPPRAKFVNPPPMTAPAYFQDRHLETRLIADFLRTDGLRLLSVVGRGGVGKTAMVCRLLKALETGRLPDELGELPVDGIVYLSPLGAHPVDFAHLFADLCRLLPRDDADRLMRRFRDPHETPAVLMRALLEHLQTGRWVLLLDNFEDVVDADGVGLTDSALAEGLRALLSAPEHGVKVIVTTRVAPKQLLLAHPGGQQSLSLDEGLPSPFAEDVLRAMDPDGGLGIRDAPDALLAKAQRRTRGFPRALEALAAILAADRDTTLPELLESTGPMPENLVEALVGDAFNRLDAQAQQIMQALAVYTAPVPAVALDYLLQPYQPAVDSAPVLGRLVNMQFVRRDEGRYYVHQVDRDYALERVPGGEPGDRHLDSPPFSRYALLGRAADYFLQTRTPRETWRHIDDLAPQLAEFELRVQTGDHDTAARILFDIGGGYLQRWGHYRLARDMYERLQGRLTEPANEARNLVELADVYHVLGHVREALALVEEALAAHVASGDRHGESHARLSLGGIHRTLGQPRQAIDHFERVLELCKELGHRGGQAGALSGLGSAYGDLGWTQRAIVTYEEALAAFREVGSRQGEAAALTSLGFCYRVLGELPRAIGFYEQALPIFREVGDRSGESDALRNLGVSYRYSGSPAREIELDEEALRISREIGDRFGEAAGLTGLGNAFGIVGEIRRSIACHEEAGAIFREMGDRSNEGVALGNVGNGYGDLGDVRRAIEHLQQALAIFREIERREAEALALISLADAYGESGNWEAALRLAREGVVAADEVELAQGSAQGRVTLAVIHLVLGDFEPAWRAAEEARGAGHPSAMDDVALVVGIALARLGRRDEAAAAFREALAAADGLLAQTPGTYNELDNRALALCGLALTEDAGLIGEAATTFGAARAAASSGGIVSSALRLFDLLAACDGGELIAPVRPAAAGTVRAAAVPGGEGAVAQSPP